MKKPGFSEVLSSMGESRAERGGRLCPVELADFSVCEGTGKKVARVTLTTNIANYNEQEIASAFSERFNRRLRIVEDSVSEVGEFAGRKYFSALALHNVRSVPYADNIGKMKAVSSSTFLDDDAQVWSVIGTGDSRRLVVECEDDLATVLASRKKYAQLPEHASACAVANGDYAMYYDAAKGRMEFGLVMLTKKGVVLANRQEEIDVAIDPKMIVTAQTTEETRNLFENPYVEVSAEGATKVLEYFRKLFKNTPFFVNWEAAIKRKKAA